VFRIDRRLLQSFDWFLLALVALLLAVGFANLWSATYAGVESGLPWPVRRQLFALALGGVGMLSVLFADYRHFERLTLPFYLGVLVLLGITLLLAPVTRGNRSWLVLGTLRFQPSELAKLALVLCLARFFYRNPPQHIHRLRDLAWPALFIAAPVGLIVLQRDMGVALLLLFVGATYFLLVRIPLRAWIPVVVAALFALAGAWRFALRPYQRSRILDVLDPARDPLASGYQALQSRIAVGSGGLFGQGYLEGTQTQLRFLPTQHTDFIFSVLAEEWGFIGCLVVLAVYLILLVWGLLIARSSKDGFGALLAVGVVGMFFWPAAINIAMVLGLAPVIGVPLPLFSYGGSSLLVSFLALGLLFNVSMRRYVF